MAIANYFYNASTKKYIAIFGMMFNKLSVTRTDPYDDAVVQSLVVPISYGPYQKFLARLEQDPNLDRKTAIQLPRMSFEITGMSYDGSRKIGSLKKLRPDTADESFQYAPAPYNIEFTLNIMTKYAEDGVQLLEQIIPFFKPERTTTVQLIEGHESLDIPLILNGVSMEDLYEGDFITRRSILWSLNFTMKGYYFGPSRERKVIKFMDIRYYTTSDENLENVVAERITQVYPGLTEDGEPTDNPENTIPYNEIYRDDDWGTIIVVEDFDPEEHEPE